MRRARQVVPALAWWSLLFLTVLRLQAVVNPLIFIEAALLLGTSQLVRRGWWRLMLQAGLVWLVMELNYPGFLPQLIYLVTRTPDWPGIWPYLWAIAPVKTLAGLLLIWASQEIVVRAAASPRGVWLATILGATGLVGLEQLTGLQVLTYLAAYLGSGLVLSALHRSPGSYHRAWGMALSAGCILLALLLSPHPPNWNTGWPDIPGPSPAPAAAGAGLAGRSGYALDDSMLGGPQVMDDTVVLEVHAAEAAYWRGESKDLYTGRGWEVSRPHDLHRLAPGESLPRANIPGRIFPQEITVRDGSFALLFAAPQVQSFQLITPARRMIYYDPEEDRFSAGRLQPGFTYRVNSWAPRWESTRLTAAGRKYPEEITRRYLQLPTTLPARVHQLAAEITRGRDNPYDQVQALVDYLEQSYSYDLEVPFPSPEADFADDFLFNLRRGYCDHFSTALVILARSIGVPARWVKGFAPGEATGTDGEGTVIFQVRNYDAHSWAEVYFQGYGWVSFDPTPGFSLPAGFLPVTPEASAADDAATLESSPLTADMLPQAGATSLVAWWKYLLWLGIATGGTGLGWLYRRRLYLFWIRWAWQHTGDPEAALQRFYPRLASFLGRWGISRLPADTPRRLGFRVEQAGYAWSAAWQELTLYYEKARFGPGLTPGESTRSREAGLHIVSAWLARR